jgi:hypothetical protein
MGRYGYSIFCDDIRKESGGKLSFIGCYNGVIFVSSQFPLSLPRFCIHLHIFSPSTMPFSSIVARCYTPGEDRPIFEQPIEPPEQTQQRELVAHLEKEAAAPLYIVAGTSLIFSPLEIRGPGLIRVRAVIDGADEEMRLGSLRIEAMRPETRSPGTIEHPEIDLLRS